MRGACTKLSNLVICCKPYEPGVRSFSKSNTNLLLATHRYKAFDTPNRMPVTRWRLQDAMTSRSIADNVVLVAELGSFTMEFTRLSMLTGDPKWYDAVERITRLFAEQQSKTHLPGMWPVVVDARTPDLTRDTWFTLGAMADSVYEVIAHFCSALCCHLLMSVSVLPENARPPRRCRGSLQKTVRG